MNKLNYFLDSAKSFQNAYDSYQNLSKNEEYKEFVEISKIFEESKSTAKKEAKNVYKMGKEFYLKMQNSFDENSKSQKKLKEWGVKFEEKGIKVSEKGGEFKSDLGEQMKTYLENYDKISKCKLFTDKQIEKKNYKKTLFELFSKGETKESIQKTLNNENVKIGKQAFSKISYFYNKYQDSVK